MLKDISELFVTVSPIAKESKENFTCGRTWAITFGQQVYPFLC